MKQNKKYHKVLRVKCLGKIIQCTIDVIKTNQKEECQKSIKVRIESIDNTVPGISVNKNINN